MAVEVDFGRCKRRSGLSMKLERRHGLPNAVGELFAYKPHVVLPPLCPSFEFTYAYWVPSFSKCAAKHLWVVMSFARAFFHSRVCECAQVAAFALARKRKALRMAVGRA